MFSCNLGLYNFICYRHAKDAQTPIGATAPELKDELARKVYRECQDSQVTMETSVLKARPDLKVKRVQAVSLEALEKKVTE